MADLERPTSALDNLTRLNLLDIVLERSRTSTKKSIIHSMIYIGRLNSDLGNSQQAVADFHERFFKSFGGQFQVEIITGLLLLYPGHFVHIVEGPENVLHELLDGVTAKSTEHVMKDLKLLVYKYDAPTRLFSMWSFRVLNLMSVRMDESKMQDSLEVKVSEAISFLLKLANELSKFPKSQLKANLDQLTTKFANMLPPQDLLESLLKEQKLSTVYEYHRKNNFPLNLTLDSELVWPIPSDFLAMRNY